MPPPEHDLPASTRPCRQPTQPRQLVGRRQGAFTLVEMLIVLAILSILVMLAKPSFDSLLARYRVHTAAQAVEATFYLARSEAVKHRGNIVWQKTPAANCAGSNIAGRWECGWQLFVDTNGNGRLDTDEHLVQTVSAQRGVRITRAPGANTQTLNRWGRTGLGAAHYLVMPEQDAAKSPPDYSRAALLCISAGGRVRTLKGVAPPCA